MKRITLTILSMAMAAGLAGAVNAETTAQAKPAAKPAVASTATPRVDAREARQHARIRQGVRSGELTRHEARSLRRDQRHIARVERRAKADGQVTPAERARLNKAQNHESRKIYRLKHNERERRPN
jgi:hypothetical protein